MSEEPAPYRTNKDYLKKAEGLKFKEYNHAKDAPVADAYGLDSPQEVVTAALFDFFKGVLLNIHTDRFIAAALKRVPPRFLAIFTEMMLSGKLAENFRDEKLAACLAKTMEQPPKRALPNEGLYRRIMKDLVDSLWSIELSSERVEALEKFITDEEVPQEVRVREIRNIAILSVIITSGGPRSLR